MVSDADNRHNYVYRVEKYINNKCPLVYMANTEYSKQKRSDRKEGILSVLDTAKKQSLTMERVKAEFRATLAKFEKVKQ